MKGVRKMTCRKTTGSGRVFETVFGKNPGKYVTKYLEKSSDRDIED